MAYLILTDPIISIYLSLLCALLSLSIYNIFVRIFPPLCHYSYPPSPSSTSPISPSSSSFLSHCSFIPSPPLPSSLLLSSLFFSSPFSATGRYNGRNNNYFNDETSGHPGQGSFTSSRAKKNEGGGDYWKGPSESGPPGLGPGGNNKRGRAAWMNDRCQGQKKYCLVLSCLVLSCLVLSCLVLSRHVLSRLVLSCHVLSRHVLSCLVMSYLVVSCLVMSCLVLSTVDCSPVLIHLKIGGEAEGPRRGPKEKVGRCH